MERRLHARKARSYPVEYFVLEPGRPAETHQTVTVDVSDGGLGIRTAEAFEQGEQLSLELRPEPDRRPVLAMGQVIGSRPDGDAWITGVELVWVDGGAVDPDVAMRPQAMWSFL